MTEDFVKSPMLGRRHGGQGIVFLRERKVGRVNGLCF